MHAGFLSFEDDHEWDDVPRLGIAESAPGVGAVVASVGVRDEAGNRWRLDLLAGMGHSPFRDVRCAGRNVYVGFGGQVIVFSSTEGLIARHSLDGYFGGFVTAAELGASSLDEAVFAASASELLKFAPDGRVEWRAPALGIDGVVAHRITEGVIEGDGEWDPPGGWKPFRVRLETGERIAAD